MGRLPNAHPQFCPPLLRVPLPLSPTHTHLPNFPGPSLGFGCPPAPRAPTTTCPSSPSHGTQPLYQLAMPCNKSPQTQQVQTTRIYHISVPMGQRLGTGSLVH